MEACKIQGKKQTRSVDCCRVCFTFFVCFNFEYTSERVCLFFILLVSWPMEASLIADGCLLFGGLRLATIFLSEGGVALVMNL